nr:EamA family transporter [Paenibacillus sp. D9]
MIVSILLGACAQILMKMGTMKIQLSLLSVITNINIISGLVCYGLSACLWIVAISKIDLSFAYPMVALGYVIVFILSYFLLGESISILRMAGLVTIVLGVIMIAKS